MMPVPASDTPVMQAESLQSQDEPDMTATATTAPISVPMRAPVPGWPRATHTESIPAKGTLRAAGSAPSQSAPSRTPATGPVRVPISGPLIRMVRPARRLRSDSTRRSGAGAWPAARPASDSDRTSATYQHGRANMSPPGAALVLREDEVQLLEDRPGPVALGRDVRREAAFREHADRHRPIRSLRDNDPHQRAV